MPKYRKKGSGIGVWWIMFLFILCLLFWNIILTEYLYNEWNFTFKLGLEHFLKLFAK
jgi:hypothetical protein